MVPPPNMPTDQTDLGNPSFETASQRSLGSVMLTVKAARTLVHTYNLSICVRNSASFQLHSYTESLRTLRLCQKKKIRKKSPLLRVCGLWTLPIPVFPVPGTWLSQLYLELWGKDVEWVWAQPYLLACFWPAQGTELVPWLTAQSYEEEVGWNISPASL